MSSALLRFQQASSNPTEPELIAASVEVSPQPLAITEQGNLIYRNPSFAQIVSRTSTNGSLPHSSWETTHFSLAGRDFSLVTPRTDSAGPSRSDLQYFAAIGRLVAGVAHDFNNLLTGILLYCDLLQSKAGTDSALIKKTDEIRHAAEQGASLIRQLMTVGREQPGEPASVCFDHVVADLEQLLRHLLGEQIAIEMDLRAHAGRVGITSAQAQQIILNLAINARDAMPAGGVLKIESRSRKLESADRRIFELIVADAGHGMDAPTTTRAFDPFFSTKSSRNGTGLTTVKAIIDAAHGEITLESSPGRGTRVIVHLPEILQDPETDQALDPIGRSTRRQSEDRGATQ